jgi:23S rRNA (cytosine1962-C5)-methyltransferase
MFSPHEYQLIDAGAGRKLERFGAVVIDRPCPAAETLAIRDPPCWQQADLRYERTTGDRGRWPKREGTSPPVRWTIRHGSCRFELSPNPFGHLGLFPEQAANWDWLAEQIAAAGRPVKLLNLFAYTGGSTLAAAAAGASVTHVDAAKNVVARARRNAELSNLAEAPLRWIAEDAARFVDREIRRGNRYDGFILDPPSYGHGPKGELWQIDRHLEPLCESLASLAADSGSMVLLTCHSPEISDAALARLAGAILDRPRNVTAGEMSLVDAAGRAVNSGAFARGSTW